LLSFGFALKLTGVEWSDQLDLLIAMQWLTRIGIAESVEIPKNGKPIWMIRRATASTTY
jgi:hypothetical protein